MECLPLAAGTLLLLRRSLQRAHIDHQYSPSQWSNRLAADGSKQFTSESSRNTHFLLSLAFTWLLLFAIELVCYLFCYLFATC